MGEDKMIEFKTGDIFASEMETLVNPVNCVGVMGGGLALEFKRRYPESYSGYLQWCKDKPTPGSSFSFCRELEKDPMTKKLHNVICLPTKDHFKNPSTLEYVEASLVLFVALHKALNIKSVAIPALGCGLGGLSWEDVRPLMVKHLSNLYIPVEVYEPQ